MALIVEVQRALGAFLRPGLPDGCAVRFAAPSPATTAETSGSPAPTADALALFLADIREDEKGAGTDWTDIRDENGIVVARRPPVRRFDLHYLLTAATDDPDREAELLDAVLRTVDPGRRLDPALLGEAFAEFPVVLRLGTDAATAYARLGLPPRTALALIVNAPLLLPLVTDIAPPADRIKMDMGQPDRPGAAPAPKGTAAAPIGTAATPAGAPAGSAASRAGRRWRGAVIEE